MKEPWQTPVYNAQCKTAKIAGEIAGSFSNVLASSYIMSACMKPPYCLRIVKAYRTPAIQQFRDAVAKAARQSR